MVEEVYQGRNLNPAAPSHDARTNATIWCAMSAIHYGKPLGLVQSLKHKVQRKEDNLAEVLFGWASEGGDEKITRGYGTYFKQRGK